MKRSGQPRGPTKCVPRQGLAPSQRGQPAASEGHPRVAATVRRLEHISTSFQPQVETQTVSPGSGGAMPSHGSLSKGTRVSDRQRCGWAVNSENALGFGIWRSPKAASPAAHTSVTCNGFDSVTGLSSLGHVLLKDLGPRPMRWMMTGCRALVRVKPKNSIEGNHLAEPSWVSGIVPEASTKHSWWVLCSSLQLRTSRLRKPICLGAHTWEAADVRSEPRSY